MQNPAFRIGCQLLFRRCAERYFFLTVFINNIIRLPNIKKPLVFTFKFGVQACDRLTEGNRLANGIFRKGFAFRPVHHRRADIVGRNDGIKRRCRSMHHKSFVKTPRINRLTAFPDMNHRRLRKRSQQLMSRLRRKNGGIAFVVVFGISIHCKPIFIYRIKPGITIPGFVKMQTVDAFSQQIFHPGHIITQTVVCGVGNNRMHRLRVNTVFNQRIFTNGFRNCGLSQTIRMYRADNAVLVARRNQICRNGARHRNCVFHRLMTVAVAQGNLIAGYAGHQNHPV